jgi:hypothetical protein
MATGVTRYSREVLAVPALRKDGTRLSLEFTIILLRMPQAICWAQPPSSAT